MDKRMVKTKKAIQNALVELAQEKELNQITVTDIAKRAEINRKTFYAHYSCAEDVLTEIEDEFVRLFEKDIKDLNLLNVEHSFVLFDRVSKRFDNNMPFYKMLFTGKLGYSFYGKLTDMFIEKSNAMFEKSPLTKEQVSMISGFCIAGSGYIYRNWFVNHQDIPIEEIAKDAGILMMQGVNGYKRIKEGKGE